MRPTAPLPAGLAYPTEVGLNPADGNPFADNGTVPEGNNVAFIQTLNTTNWLATTISNLTVGITYRVTCRINSRVATATPTMWLGLNGATVNTFTVTPMHALNVAGPYGFAYGTFTATNTTAALVVSSHSATDPSPPTPMPGPARETSPCWARPLP